MVEGLDPVGGQAGAVGGDDLGRDVPEAGPEVVARLEADDRLHCDTSGDRSTTKRAGPPVSAYEAGARTVHVAGGGFANEP